MSIHHRKQGQINKRREQIQQRIRGGVLEAWLVKERNRRRRKRGLPPLPTNICEADSEPDDEPAPSLLSVAEILGLLAFWCLVFFR